MIGKTSKNFVSPFEAKTFECRLKMSSNNVVPECMYPTINIGRIGEDLEGKLGITKSFWFYRD